MSFGDGVHVTLQFSNDVTGVPHSQPKLFHYATGGTTLKDIYSDAARATPLAQPFVGTTGGRLNFFVDPEDDYHFVIKTNDELTTLFDRDPIRVARGNPHQGIEDFGTTAPSTPTDKNLNHTFLQVAADGELVDWLGCFDTDDPEYQSILSAILATQGIANLRTKSPIAMITHPDFSGGASTSKSAAENQTSIQAAVDWAIANHGAVFSPPLGGFETDEILIAEGTENIFFFGAGWNSIWKMDSSAVADDQILSGVNIRQLIIQNMMFDGNGIGNTTHLLEFTKTSGTFMNVVLDNLRFTNSQGASAVKIAGVGQTFSPVVVRNCNFEDLDNALHIVSCKPIVTGNTFYDINNSVTAKPMFFDSCVNGVVQGNMALVWGANVAGLHLTDCTNFLAGYNSLPGTEAYGILTDGSSNSNIITNNDVSGSHSTSALTFAGASSIIHSNLGTSAFQNGAIITSGGANIQSYNHKLYDSQTTSSEGTSNGQLNDTDVTFNDIVSIADPTASNYDLVHFPSLAKYKWVVFAVRTVNTINQLQLGSSDQMDIAITIPDEEVYDIYPNIFDPGFFESTPFTTVAITRGSAGSVTGVLSSVITEKEFLKVVLKDGTAGASTATDIDVFLDDYQDIVTGDAFKVTDALDISAITANTVFATFILWADDTEQDITIKLTQVSGGQSYIDIEVFRMKRAVDE